MEKRLKHLRITSTFPIIFLSLYAILFTLQRWHYRPVQHIFLPQNSRGKNKEEIKFFFTCFKLIFTFFVFRRKDYGSLLRVANDLLLSLVGKLPLKLVCRLRNIQQRNHTLLRLVTNKICCCYLLNL